jgi:hypothetical protein
MTFPGQNPLLRQPLMLQLFHLDADHLVLARRRSKFSVSWINF